MSENVRIYNRLPQALGVNIVNAEGKEESVTIPAKGYVVKPKDLVESSPDVQIKSGPQKSLIAVREDT